MSSWYHLEIDESSREWNDIFHWDFEGVSQRCIKGVYFTFECSRCILESSEFAVCLDGNWDTLHLLNRTRDLNKIVYSYNTRDSGKDIIKLAYIEDLGKNIKSFLFLMRLVKPCKLRKEVDGDIGNLYIEVQLK